LHNKIFYGSKKESGKEGSQESSKEGSPKEESRKEVSKARIVAFVGIGKSTHSHECFFFSLFQNYFIYCVRKSFCSRNVLLVRFGRKNFPCLVSKTVLEQK